MPVHGCLQVSVILDLDVNRAFLFDAQRGAGYRSVVRKHPNFTIPDLLDHWSDSQGQPITIVQVLDLCFGVRGKTIGFGGKGSCCVCHWDLRVTVGWPMLGTVGLLNASIWLAINSASSLTHPMSAEPRV